MGWSCRAEAGNVLRAWTDACVEATGSSNNYETNGARYFFEVSNTEHPDGAITGTVYRVTHETEDGRVFCRKSGSFRIEGDGTVARATAFLKKAAKNAKPVYGAVGSGGASW